MTRYELMLRALAAGDLESDAKARLVVRVQRALIREPAWLARRVLSRLEGYPRADACWIWTGVLDDGYGRVCLPNGGPMVRTHRAVWIAMRGPIPGPLVLDHDGPSGCHNRACANPAHLQAVTIRHNTLMTGNSTAVRNLAKTRCPAGHPLSGENLRPDALKAGARGCATCRREWLAQRWVVVAAAAKALGLDTKEYRRLHGMSVRTARRLLATSRDMALEIL